MREINNYCFISIDLLVKLFPKYYKIFQKYNIIWVLICRKKFESFKYLECYVRDENKFKQTEKKNQTHPENKIDKQFSFTDDRRGLHQQHYHNQARR